MCLTDSGSAHLYSRGRRSRAELPLSFLPVEAQKEEGVYSVCGVVLLCKRRCLLTTEIVFS